MRQWPAEHFAVLIDLLVKEAGASVVLIGTPDERSLAHNILRRVANRTNVHSALGKITLADLPRLIAGCDLFIGNNSGPHHLAAALGVRTIGIHSGVVDAMEWGPLGPKALALQKRMLCSPLLLVKVGGLPSRTRLSARSQPR